MYLIHEKFEVLNVFKSIKRRLKINLTRELKEVVHIMVDSSN